MAAQDTGAEAERVAETFLRSAVGGPTQPTRRARRRARFHTLTIAEVRALTDDAIEVTFGVPAALADAFDYLPGQHVALRADVGGREVRRSYSLCRSPATRPDGGRDLSIAIKRDPGGSFSRWAHEQLHPGHALDVMSPQGTFTITLPDLDGAHIAGIAAGSGITPLMALATTVLSRSDSSRYTLVYTNRSTRDVMFLDDLADLKDRFPARFALYHVLTREQRAVPLLSGRMDEARLRRILDRLVLPATVDEWFLCGPMDLVQLCRDTLAEMGVSSTHVRYELFTSDDGRLPEPDRGGHVPVREDEPVRAIAFILDGQTTRVLSPIAANESVLTAALRVRPDVPFACAGGVCGTCRARLLSGSVHMTENYALEPDELERGYVLTCQSHPTSDEIVVDYDA